MLHTRNLHTPRLRVTRQGTNLRLLKKNSILNPQPPHRSSLTSRNEPALALLSYAKAIDLLPTNAAAAFNYAELLFAVGKHKEASEMFQRSADLFAAQLGASHARTQTAIGRMRQSAALSVSR